METNKSQDIQESIKIPQNDSSSNIQIKSSPSKNSTNSKNKKNKLIKQNKYKVKQLDLEKIKNIGRSSIAFPQREEKDEEETKKYYNEINKFEYIYSPRTSYINELLEEEKLFYDLGVCFDPVAIKIIKSFFKERLGELSEIEFIKVIRNNLHSWHPELPDRIRILSKLLIKLFDDIDLNNNKTIEWDEFTNYIIHSGDNVFHKKLNYQLKLYVPAKNTIEHTEFSDLITHAFYIEKFNLIGIVVEGKSHIVFYDADTCKKTKTYIDIKETQSKIDKMEFNLLEKKAEEMLLKKEEEKKLKIALHQEKLKKKGFTNYYSIINNTLPSDKKNDKDYDSDSLSKKKNRSDLFNKSNSKEIKKDKDKHKNVYMKTSTNVQNIKMKDFHKKLTVLCTCFIDEYNLLFVSSSNNIISAWKFVEQNFKNINYISESEKAPPVVLKNSTIYSCPLLSADLPQNTMDWDPVQKKLYSGQGDGKILIWDILKSKGKEEACLDYKRAKEKHNKEGLRKSFDESVMNMNKNTMNTKNSFKKAKKKNELPKDQQVLKISKYEKVLSNIKTDMSRDGVSSIKVLGKMQMIAAGYFNGCVIIWDLMLKDYRKFYSDQNTGIYQIAYDSNKKLIFTCGFDHNIYIYDPYIDGYPINILTGHNWSVNSIACDEVANEFLSIDIYGNIKVWDLNNFYNYQTINLNETVNIQIQSNTNKKLSSNQKMILLTKVNKIFTYGEKLMVFTKENASLPDLCDNQPILGCFYREHKFQFVTVCLKKIKIWNIFNGKILRIYEDFLSGSTTEITSYVSDKSTKKLYIGESTGIISCIDVNIGKVIVNFEKHNSEIIALRYSDKNFMLISLSYDGVIKIHKEIELTKISILKTFSLDSFKIMQIEYSETFSRLIIGSDQGDLRFFDVQYLRQDSYNELIYNGKEKIKKTDQISTIFAFQDLPIILAGHDSGINRFIIIPPNNFKYHIIKEFTNFNEKDGKKFVIKLFSCCYDVKNRKLFTADFFGFVHCYSMNKLYDIIKENNPNNEINMDVLKKIEDLNNDIMDQLFILEAHKECIKSIINPNLNPNIIITTGNDRHVKLFSAEDGTFIDELSQCSEKHKECPLGIKYYLTDPFVSKIDKNNKKEENIVYRTDIKNFKYNKVKNVLNNMRKNKSLISDYCNKITEINAKEKLYLLTLNSPIPENRSTLWKFEPNINEIKEKEKQKYDMKLKEIFKKDDNFLYNNKYELITSNQYYPLFIRQMDEDALNNYSEALNNKMRKIQLTTSKILLKNNDFIEFEKERRNGARKINYETELEFVGKSLFSKKEFKSEKFDLLNKERQYRYGINKTVFKTNEEKFNNYKEDFQRNLLNLEKSIEDKLTLRYFSPGNNFNGYNSTNKFNKLKKNSKAPVNKSTNINFNISNDTKLPLIKNKSNVSKSNTQNQNQNQNQS